MTAQTDDRSAPADEAGSRNLAPVDGLAGSLPYRDDVGNTAAARVDRAASDLGRSVLVVCDRCHAIGTARVRGHQVLDWGLPRTASKGRRHAGFRSCGGSLSLFDTGRSLR